MAPLEDKYFFKVGAFGSHHAWKALSASSFIALSESSAAKRILLISRLPMMRNTRVGYFLSATEGFEFGGLSRSGVHSTQVLLHAQLPQQLDPNSTELRPRIDSLQSFFFRLTNSRASRRSPGPRSKISPPKTNAASSSFNVSAPFSLRSTDPLLSTYRLKVSMSPSMSVIYPMSSRAP